MITLLLTISFIIIVYKFLPKIIKAYYLYKNKQVPLNFKFDHSKNRSKQVIDSYDNLPFPTGWYMLCPSFELKKGESKYINALGLDIVLYRGDDNKPYCVYAYCSHLGANLQGGKVKDDCITCPFHNWKFDGNGKCKEIPYDDCEKRDIMNIKSWNIIEYDNMICFYYNNNNNNNNQNSDTSKNKIYDINGVGSVDGMIFGGIKSNYLNMNIQEWVENSADYAHFNIVHDKLVFPILNKLFYAKFDIVTEYIDHYADFNLTTYIYPIWKNEPIQQAFTNIKIWGPGGVSYWTFYTPLGKLILIKSALPYDNLTIKVTDMWYYEPSMPIFLVMYIVIQALYAFNEDVIIWEKKIYKEKPILVKNDGPIMKFRKWYKNFYNTNCNYDW